MKPVRIFPLCAILVWMPACGSDESGQTDDDVADLTLAPLDAIESIDVDCCGGSDLWSDSVVDTRLGQLDTAAGDGTISVSDVVAPDQSFEDQQVVTDLVAQADADDSIDTATPPEDTLVVADLVADVDAGDPEPLTVGEQCFSDIWDPQVPGPNYDQFAPVVADHCFGTNHQTIVDIQHVVILGDSVTQGTPNLAHALSTDNSHFYRNLLAEWLAAEFELDKGNLIDWGFFKAYDYVSGKGGKLQSGAFKNCSKWGARTDDFLEGGKQILECFPDGGSTLRTLIFFTMGGNDIASITEKGGEASDEEVAAGYPKAWDQAASTVEYLREAMFWLKDPLRFPNGSYVVFASPYEFTDGTGVVEACPAASLAGFKQWKNKEVQEQIVIWMLEQYMDIAVETQTDMIWLLEHFCGHGYVATGMKADPENRCYRGPDTPLWFDETCTHPNEAGHKAIYQMFRATIEE
ncbi:MAG: SGNH/GDSL hydrolase family protein [Myxococcales bacterium]|nr:SGNH/GDSL hydrolase family protein [Myxococcales bacterium]